MEASLIVSPLLQALFDKLLHSDVRINGGFIKEFDKLREELLVIQAVMEDAEERQRKDKKVKIWLARLRDVASDADDLLDVLNTYSCRLIWLRCMNSDKLEERHRELELERVRCRPVRRGLLVTTNYLRQREREIDLELRELDLELRERDLELRARQTYSPKRLVMVKLKRMADKVRMTSMTLKFSFSFKYQMWRKPKEIREVRERFAGIAKEMSGFQFKEDRTAYRRSDTKERRKTGPYVDESKVYGRKEDVDKIVEMLLSSSSITSSSSGSSDVPVVPIVGFGGIGKTTLAQLVYNDERVASHFDLKMWVSANDRFNTEMIINGILDYAYATKSRRESSQFGVQLGVLQSQLRESLCTKRYLLVLDDVWNQDPDEWDKIRNPLRGGTNESKIIVTTRSEKVASIMGTTPPYHLEGLTKYHCWNLFKQRAFPDGDEESFPILLGIGEQIVNKCKGAPFAANALGSLMRYKRRESEWLHVKDSELWSLDEGENRMLNILRLSYNHMPAHLKRCFAYCSVLPKNCEISREKLIHKWMAEALIESQDNTLSLEDIGNEYFNDLLMMSFFQSVRKSDDSCITEFKMHDLFHDLAKSIAGDQYLTLEHNSLQRTPTQNHDLAKTRHALVVCNYRSSLVPRALYKARKLRTLHLLSPGDDSGEALCTTISAFKYLRVLDLSGCGIQRLHGSIGDMIYLRYLDISGTLVQALPKTICQLFNLQTLNLSGCNDLVELPRGLKRLINLRHLNIKDCAGLTRMPESIGDLSHLRTLPVYIVGNSRFESVMELAGINHLQGELHIKHLENSRSVPRPVRGSNSIRHLCIDSLGLSWGNDDVGKTNSHASRNIAGNDVSLSIKLFFEFLQPHPNVRRLLVNGYPGISFPPWINQDCLGNLIHLELINCGKCDSLPTLGQLPALKVLNVRGMDSVVSIGPEFYGEGSLSFPSLNELSFINIPNLKTWDNVRSMDAFTCLNRLTIKECPRLTTMPWFPSLGHLELHNCNTQILWPASKLNSLSTLIIDVFREPTYLPKGLFRNNSGLTSVTISSCPLLSSLPGDMRNLEALKSLTIRWCEELSSLPQEIRHLTSLESLEIIECPRLISLPEESFSGLCSLRSLSIENCTSLASLPTEVKHLRALEHLTIMYCLSLAYLPDGLQHLLALRSLHFICCPELASLPEGLQHLKILQNLEIRICPKLMELPEWVEHLDSLRSLTISECPHIKSIPGGLQRLSALQHLSISDCPDLEKRCERVNGEDWHKISHIPYTYIGSSTLQQRHGAGASTSSGS